jgi:signal transduction histidine kinase
MRELTPVTLRVIKHDLRTPINHVIGYSEMLIEDLDARTDAAVLAALQVVLDAGKEMLAAVNAHVGAGSDPESFISSDVLASLRQAVGAGVSRVRAAQLEDLGLGRSATFSSDVRKVLDGARRLTEFAHTGELPSA